MSNLALTMQQSSDIESSLTVGLDVVLEQLARGIQFLEAVCGDRSRPAGDTVQPSPPCAALDVSRAAVEALQNYRHRLVDQIERQKQELLDSHRQVLHNEKLASVGQLASGIAHEINTPIQYIGDNLRALKDFFDDLSQMMAEYRALTAKVAAGRAIPADASRIAEIEQRHDVDYILQDAPKAIEQGLEGAGRVAGIVRAMRAFSHQDVGPPAPVDINRAIDNTLTVARNAYKYVADVEKDFGSLINIECYAGAVNQVLLNLLVNAAHAIEDTGRRGLITIRTRQLDDGVEIMIADTGTGIPKAIQGRIFDPFFTTKQVGRGTGQGLSIIHQIVVQMHGGSIRFTTQEGRGTQFYVILPTKQHRNEEVPAAAGDLNAEREES